ncbi:MAG TPA: hypothetical protein PKO06_17390, partial [Candidatus Ozemobacteraceae bacterium]|nr:hypothetical protein [Candidatus Ozemobacteraceae bacterium]
VAWLLNKPSSAPRGRMLSLMAELLQAQAVLQHDTTEGMVDYTQNTERNLIQILHENPELLKEAKASPATGGLQNVFRAVETMSTFSTIHHE